MRKGQEWNFVIKNRTRCSLLIPNKVLDGEIVELGAYFLSLGPTRGKTQWWEEQKKERGVKYEARGERSTLRINWME